MIQNLEVVIALAAHVHSFIHLNYLESIAYVFIILFCGTITA